MNDGGKSAEVWRLSEDGERALPVVLRGVAELGEDPGLCSVGVIANLKLSVGANVGEGQEIVGVAARGIGSRKSLESSSDAVEGAADRNVSPWLESKVHLFEGGNIATKLLLERGEVGWNMRASLVVEPRVMSLLRIR